MDLATWKSFYEKILDDFGYGSTEDLKSAEILEEMIEKFKNNVDLNKISKKILGKEVYIFGAGPSLKKHVLKLKENIDSNITIIAADGATKALLEENIVPDIIVSDLDGDIDSILKSNDLGSIVVAHAHGDNIDKLEKYIELLKNIVGSTQFPKKFDLLVNYGGFTDGDRCCFLAEEFGAKKIILCGMDFGIYVTKYSRPKIENDVELADEVKVKKLKYAEMFVNWLVENGNSPIEFMA
uniref:6-hydroxymethyl-7,8-dihydropterin pyrophosphokinase n=1 Tax=Methanococcus maripaludis (strain C6 / ATCC BAA-1332) TaxID=444158 RepID=A9A683_METM6